jgi:two-component system chemotaxis response regulator CheY
MKQVSLANLTVLVVDDDAAIRMLISTMLRRLAIKPVDAENGAQAVQLFRTAPALFDLVICDWNMPGLSGIDLCQQLRAERPELPFLLVTGRGDAASVKTAQENRVSSYILKPFSPADLKAKIVAALA